MINTMNKFLQSLNNEKILIACSTGVDSMTLLHMVLKLYDHKLIYVAHVNHNVRKESKIEEEYISNFCKENNIKLFIKRLDKIESNFESTARELRLSFFKEICQKENIHNVLLAHHAQDNLETILMRLFRSSSLKAYAGIPFKTTSKDINFYHPLINNTKEEIIEYAKNNNIKYYEDSTNHSLDYERNRIRNLVIPNLIHEVPNYNTSISNYSNTLSEADTFINSLRDEYIDKNVKKDNNLFFDIDSFLNLKEYLQKQVVFELLKPYKPSTTCIDEVLKNIRNNTNKIVYKITNDINFIKEYGIITFTTKDIKELEYKEIITKEGTYNLPNGMILEVNKNSCNILTHTKKICYNIDSLPITIRSRMIGDTIKRKKLNKETNEYEYYNQTISNYLTNKKVKYLDRINILVIEKDNQVIHILGYKL